MKRGFSLIELIISISLISVVFVFSFVAIKNIDTTYVDPYEEIRTIISDATNLYLNTNVGIDVKNKLYKDGIVTINTNALISEGLLNEEYFVNNTNENLNVENLVINVSLDSEGFLNYTINIEN